MITLKQLNELQSLIPYLKPDALNVIDRLLRTEQLALPPSKERQRELIEICRNSPWEFVNRFCWTYDPREKNPNMPFNLFERQKEFLQWLQGREAAKEEGLAEKCRDVGFTWLCCAYALHGWLFRKSSKCGFGSRKLELVDRLGDPDCIFEKIRFLRDRLPKWLMQALAKGFNPRKHDGRCKILNPQNKASIIGEGGDNIGRGGRCTYYFVDEAAFLARPKKVDAALSQNTNVRIWVSTPNGLGNSFAQKRFGGIEVFTFRWWEDPRKDVHWYLKQKRTLDPVIVAQEIDIDYAASIEGICIPAKWVLAAIGLKLPESERKVAGLDVAAGGKNKNVLIVRAGPVVKEIHDWSQINTTQTAYDAADHVEKAGGAILCYDCIGVGAGVQSAYASSEREFNFETRAVLSGAGASDLEWPDSRKSSERFLNKRAELWWMLRTRFEKAWEYKEFGIAHPLDEMISIPNNADLIAQLSMPLFFTKTTGKTYIESKADMKKRGVLSPDFADALMFTMEDYLPEEGTGDVTAVLPFLRIASSARIH